MLSCIMHKQVDVYMVTSVVAHVLVGVSLTRVKSVLLVNRLLSFRHLQCLPALCTTCRFFCCYYGW